MVQAGGGNLAGTRFRVPGALVPCCMGGVALKKTEMFTLKFSLHQPPCFNTVGAQFAP
jgi:hypothetical protein